VRIQNGIFHKESFRKYFHQNRNLSEWNLSELTFWHNQNLSAWNLSEGIFQKKNSEKPESFRMKSFRRNLSESTFWLNGNLSEWNLSEGII
jgi:hypothetical protein